LLIDSFQYGTTGRVEEGAGRKCRIWKTKSTYPRNWK